MNSTKQEFNECILSLVHPFTSPTTSLYQFIRNGNDFWERVRGRIYCGASVKNHSGGNYMDPSTQKVEEEGVQSKHSTGEGWTYLLVRPDGKSVWSTPDNMVVPVGVAPGNAPVEVDARAHVGKAEQLTLVILGGSVYQ